VVVGAYYTNMDFLAVEYDVIYAIAEVNINFLVHITSYSTAKKYISVLLYNL
jgi:hypothetical protein